MKGVRALLICAVVLVIAGCAGTTVDTYQAERPVLDLRSYFEGEIDAHGMFQDRSGRVVKRFKVDIKGTWKGDIGTLEEDFLYSDGTTDRRVWTIRKIDEHLYSGTAADVIGEAKGEAYGNALRWRYVLALDVEGKIYNVDFDDWMYLMDDKVMLNRSVMRKYGVTLGEVTITFYKKS